LVAGCVAEPGSRTERPSGIHIRSRLNAVPTGSESVADHDGLPP
jgi:hypothetical protein